MKAVKAKTDINPFALTFAFASTHRQTQQKQKRVQATARVHPRPDHKPPRQFSANPTRHHLRQTEGLHITRVWRNGG